MVALYAPAGHRLSQETEPGNWPVRHQELNPKRCPDEHVRRTETGGERSQGQRSPERAYGPARPVAVSNVFPPREFSYPGSDAGSALRPAAGPSPAVANGHRDSAAAVSAVSSALDSVLTEQKNCHGLSSDRGSCATKEKSDRLCTSKRGGTYGEPRRGIVAEQRLGKRERGQVDARRDDGLQDPGRGEEDLRAGGGGEAQCCSEGVGGEVAGGEEGGMQRRAQLVAPFLFGSRSDTSLSFLSLFLSCNWLRGDVPRSARRRSLCQRPAPRRARVPGRTRRAGRRCAGPRRRAGGRPAPARTTRGGRRRTERCAKGSASCVGEGGQRGARCMAGGGWKAQGPRAADSHIFARQDNRYDASECWNECKKRQTVANACSSAAAGMMASLVVWTLAKNCRRLVSSEQPIINRGQRRSLIGQFDLSPPLRHGRPAHH
jgi:hypothetical protein